MTCIIDAHYQQHPIDCLNNNPLTEAFHVEESKVSILEKSSFTLQTEDDFWCIQDIYQQFLLEDVGDVRKPNPLFYSFYQKCVTLILHSYSKRDPLKPESMALKMELASKLYGKKKDVEFDRRPGKRTTSPSVLMSGPSGSGKTTLIRNALDCIPQVISHTEYRGQRFKQQQVVWLSIDMPATPSIKALALNFFKAVDDATGVPKYFEEWERKHRESVDRHLIGMQLVALTHEIGLVHIDELQFMLNYKKAADHPDMQIIEALFNKLGIPVVLSCTDSGLKLFDTAIFDGEKNSQEVTTLRRMLSDRAFQLQAYELNSNEFNELLCALYPSHLFLNCKELSENFKETFHHLTVGLPAFMTRLAKLHHEYLLFLYHNTDTPNELSTIDVSHLKQIHTNQFQLHEKALNYFRAVIMRGYEEEINQKSGGTEKHSSSPMIKVVENKPIKKDTQRNEAVKNSNTKLLTEIESLFPIGFKD